MLAKARRLSMDSHAKYVMNYKDLARPPTVPSKSCMGWGELCLQSFDQQVLPFDKQYRGSGRASPERE